MNGYTRKRVYTIKRRSTENQRFADDKRKGKSGKERENGRIKKKQDTPVSVYHAKREKARKYLSGWADTNEKKLKKILKNALQAYCKGKEIHV